MSSMIERVAIALEPKCRAFGKGDMPMQVAREFARSAIEAMREPTDAMEDAADEPVHEELKKQGQFSIKNYGKLAFASYPFSNSVWKAMIDAALKEQP